METGWTGLVGICRGVADVGEIDSLNVSVVVGVALFGLLRAGGWETTDHYIAINND